MQLGKIEHNAYEMLKRNGFFVFKIKDVRLLLNVNATKAYNIVKSLKKKGAVKKAGNGFLVLKESNDFIAASGINWPSYVSFWSALNYYGFSDQTPKKIFLATTKYSREIGNFKYVTLAKKRFFGYNSIGGVVIADKEKSFVDSLLFPKYAGGISEIVKCMRIAIKEIDVRRLINYTLKVESKSAVRRLGFILELIGYKGKYIKDLTKKIGKGYELLDPNLKKENNLNKRWLLDINM